MEILRYAPNENNKKKIYTDRQKFSLPAKLQRQNNELVMLGLTIVITGQGI